ncbi:sulfurtransferase TusA family protein [Sphingomonas sp. 28-63-12]|uniref:sulfurtransferase TusA family protein n=1 Tax=Sphingomonas sp. 28-63-12 TaxID=1970434 RepID=UPI000BC6A441|nr:MAG: hypothetical protein B7Y47_02555 [Sphingomonas sp. 28-63-12]
MFVIDARGQPCPWPAVRLARALREAHPMIEIMADDPAAERELTAVAVAAGATIMRLPGELSLLFHVVAPGVVNTSFTPNG